MSRRHLSRISVLRPRGGRGGLGLTAAIVTAMAVMCAVLPVAPAGAAVLPDGGSAAVTADNGTPDFLNPMSRPTSPSLHLDPTAPAATTSATLAPAAPSVVVPAAPTEGWQVGSHWKDNGDGSRSGQFFTQPEFRQVAGGWLPIDTSLVTDAAGGVTSPGSLVPLSFGVETGHLTGLALPSGPVTEAYTDSTTKAIVPSVAGQSLTYRSIAPGTDLRVSVGNTGVKEDLLLQDSSAPSTFHFHLSDPLGTLGDVTKTAPDTFQFSNEIAPGTKLGLPRPFAYEDHGGPAPASGALDSAHQSVVAAGDGFDVTLSLDPNWLQGRSFPLVLDPSLTFINGNLTVLEYQRLTSGDTACGSDLGGCIGSVPPATNPNALGAGTQTETVGSTYVADARPARAFYKFAVTSILPNSNVTTANLKLYSNGCIGYSQYNCNSNNYTEQFYPTTAAITPSSTTDTQFMAATGAVQSSFSIPAFAAGTRVLKTIGIAGVVNYWVGNDPNAYAHPNYGFGEKLSSEPTSGNIGGPSFAGPNSTDPHPEVDVTWSPPPGQMAAPSVSALSDTSLRAAFTTPSNGGPAISSYQVDVYQVGGGSPYTSQTCAAPCTNMHLDFTGLPYGSYYAVAKAANSVGFGATSAHSNTLVLSPAPQLTKTLAQAAGPGGVYGRGQTLTYTVHVSNPVATAMTVNSVTDTMPGTLLTAGLAPTLGGADCLGSGQCTLTGNTLSAGTFTIPGNGAVDLVYSVIATGVERGCSAVANTATAVNDFGSNSKTVTINVCESGLGLEPWWSYLTKAVGAQSAASVNAMNGNLVVQATDSTPVTARGRFTFVTRRSYNSQDTTALTLPGNLGAGWQLNIGQADDLAGAGVTTSGLVVPSPQLIKAPLAVTLIDRDGTRHEFTYRSASVNLGNGLDVSSLTAGSPLHLLKAVNPTLLPSSQGGSSGFPTVCVDATYQAPAGVHLALWRYVGVNNGCANELTDGSAKVLGFSAVRPDRVRNDFDLGGKLLDMVDGNGVDLRYSYTAGKLTGVSVQQACNGTIGSATCRGIVLSYPSGTETDVTDPAGRLTKYLLDSNTPQHLITVVNPPETQQGGNDHVSYSYQGFGDTCGGSSGQLCSITDARGSITRLGYTTQTIGPARVTSLTDRRGTTTTFAYTDVSPLSMTADTGTHRTVFTNIDSSGRAGEIDQGATSNTFQHVTRNIWDSSGTPCAYVAGTLKGSNTTWKRQDNNLCQLTRVNAGGTPNEVSNYTYTPEGLPLSEERVMGGSSPDLYSTKAYFTQYVRSGNQASLTATDSVSGNGDVAVGSRLAAIGDGNTVAGDGTVLYTVSDPQATLPPRGNAAGATVANFSTTYSVADATYYEPGVPSFGCSTNSGNVCSVSTPYSGSSKSTTSYSYDQFGQKLSTSLPQGGSLSYSYYQNGSYDLSGTVSTEGWLQSVTDSAGHFVVYAYDQAGNPVRTWDRNATSGASSPSSFLAAPNSRYDQTLNATLTSARPWRYPLSHTDPLGNKTAFTVDADGNQTAITSPRLNITTEVFDAADNLTQRATPLETGNPAQFHYDTFGNQDYSRSPNGTYTVRSFDTVNRLTATYTDRGPSASTTKPAACVVTDTTTNAHAPIPTGEVACFTSSSYDLTDNVLSSTDGEGQTSTFSYDAANRRLSSTVPRSTTVTYTTTSNFDADGNVTDVCPPRQSIEGGTSGCPTGGLYSSHNAYSEADRLLSTTSYRAAPTSPHGTVAVRPAQQTSTTSYSYDRDGNRTGTTDPNGHLVTDTFDLLDRKTSHTSYRLPGQGSTTAYSYDPAGNLTGTLLPGAQPLGNTSGTDLTIDGTTYGSTNPYVLPSTNATYRNLTLINNAYVTAPGSGPVTQNITISGTLSICQYCALTVDGRGSAGGTANSTVNQPGGTGTGQGGGHGGGFGASGGGGAGGASHASTGYAGSSVTAGGAGGQPGATYGDADFSDGGTLADVGSGGGAGGSTPLAAGGAGGAGGGFIHITASVMQLDGIVTAGGASGQYGVSNTGQTGGKGGSGAGGGIWLTAPSINAAGARLNAYGVGTAGPGDSGEGYLRIDADYLNVSSSFNLRPYYSRHTLGRMAAYSYDADNRPIDSITGSSSLTAASTGLVSSDGGSNVRTRKQYDPDGNITGTFEPRAFASSTTTPDRRFETVSVFDTDDRLTTSYRPYADSASVNDPLNGPATTSQCTDPAGSGQPDYSSLSNVRICKVGYSYDHDSNRTQVQLPTYTSSDTNRFYTFSYTPDDLLFTVAIPDPRQTSGSGRVTEHQYSYDGARRVVKDAQLTTQAPAVVTSYTSDGLVETVTPPAGTVSSHLISYGYDSNGNRTGQTGTQDGSTTRVSYTDLNSDNTVAEQVDPAGNTTSYGYDPAGNKSAVYSPSANAPVAANDPTNPNHLPTTLTYYDDNQLRTSSTATNTAGSQDRLTSYAYDAAGRKTSVDADYTNSSGTVTVNGNPQTFSYYQDDLLATATGRDGAAQAMSYDPAGHLSSGTDTPAGGSTTTTSATYYLNGQPRTVVENSRTTTYSYDGAGAVAARQDSTPAGNINTTYGYSDNEQPVTVAGGVTATTITLGYDDQARPISTGYGTGPTLSRTWNPDDTLASQTLSSTPTSQSWNYTYDGMYRTTAADNNNTSTDCTTGQSNTTVTPVAGLHCFNYDSAGRVQYFRDPTAARAGVYDADGNRRSDGAGIPAAPTVTATFAPDDSILTQTSGTNPTHTYAYTQPFGGITNDGCATNSYDGFDRLTSSAGSSGAGCQTAAATYTYDVLDRQTTRTESGTGALNVGTTTFGYDGLSSATTSEALPGGSTTRYTTTPNRMPLAAATTSGTTQYLSDDGHGNVTATTSVTGALACSLRYDPWGGALDAISSVAGQACTNGTGGSTPSDLLYRAGRKDAVTGNYQLGSRTYSPDKASFLTPDSSRNGSSGGDLSIGTDPLTRNSYNYVNGDPINLTDPTGHRPECPDGRCYASDRATDDRALRLEMSYAADRLLGSCGGSPGNPNGQSFWTALGHGFAQVPSAAVNGVVDSANGAGQAIVDIPTLFGNLASGLAGMHTCGLGVCPGDEQRFASPRVPAIPEVPYWYGNDKSLNPLRTYLKIVIPFALPGLKGLRVGGVAEEATVAVDESVPILRYPGKSQPMISSNMQRYMLDNGLDETSTFIKVGTKDGTANREANRLVYQGGISMEEFPFASTAQGGPGAYLTQVPVEEQAAQSRLLRDFYRTNNVGPGDPFGILIDWNH